jgi:hypothetical protein
MFTSPDSIYQIHQHRSREWEQQASLERTTLERNRSPVRMKVAMWLSVVARSLDLGLARKKSSLQGLPPRS